MKAPILSRRSFLAAGGAALTAATSRPFPLIQTGPGPRIRVYIFSKHLQWLDYADCAQTAREIGYDGVEVTLRRGGHVEPERVEDDLPRFVEACRKAGIPADAAVTDVTDAQDPVDARVLRAMSRAGITTYRLGGWHYAGDQGVPETLNAIKPALRDLVQASRELSLTAVYQNHSGAQYVGSAVWDIYDLIRDLDPRHVGYSFDIGHATIEGGYTWVNHARLALPLARHLVIKDFVWQKGPRGWQTVWCPLGEGMVDSRQYLTLVAQSSFRGVMSMHFEYDTPGNNHVDWYRNHISAQKRDLATLRRLLQEAHLT